MYDHELVFKFNPTAIEPEDITKIKCFIVYLNSLVEVCEGGFAPPTSKAKVKSVKTKRKTKKIENDVLKDVEDGVLEFVEA
jgi:hypothetical protein